MQQLSISRAWDETREVLRRDGSLIATLALALMVLPGTISNMVQPRVPAGQMAEPGWWTLVQLLALLIGVVGQLAIVQIALGRRQSVGEAIAHGARRAPAFLGATILWILPLALLVIPFAQRIEANRATPDPTSALIMVAVLLVFLFLAVRLILTTPVAGSEAAGPITILRRSWGLTRGRWWRLFGFLLLFFVAALIVITAVTSVVGVIVGLADGPPAPWSIGALVLALTSQLLSAALTVLLVLLLTRLYAQLTGPAAAESASVPDAP